MLEQNLNDPGRCTKSTGGVQRRPAAACGVIIVISSVVVVGSISMMMMTAAADGDGSFGRSAVQQKGYCFGAGPVFAEHVQGRLSVLIAPHGHCMCYYRYLLLLMTTITTRTTTVCSMDPHSTTACNTAAVVWKNGAAWDGRTQQELLQD